MLNKHGDNILIVMSALAAIMSGLDFLFHIDVLNIAGSQWMLMAIILGIYGVFAKMHTN